MNYKNIDINTPRYYDSILNAYNDCKFYDRIDITCHLLKDFKLDKYLILFGQIEVIRPSNERIIQSFNTCENISKFQK